MLEKKTKQDLTPRQKQILSLLYKGKTNNEICQILGISPNTVKVHLANIFKILGVSNRTEAVTLGMAQATPEKTDSQDLEIVFHKTNDISQYPQAYSLYLSIVEAIQQYSIFRVKATSDETLAQGFRINVSAGKDKEETLFLSTRLGNTDEILWTTSIKINSDDIRQLAQSSTMRLFRNLVIASSKLSSVSELPIPYWWYASAYCIAKLETRNQTAFEICKEKLFPLIEGDSYNEWALYVLSYAHYVAFLESWGNTQQLANELGKMTRKAMSNAPYSILSHMILAFYNIVTGNKTEAVTNLKHVIDANPQAITPRTLLVQIYMLTGNEDKALELLDECSRLIPEAAQQASVLHARVFILLLQRKYEECKKLARQVLMFTPKAFGVRMCLIACCNMTGDEAESKSHVQKLFEFYPNLCKKDLEKLLKGVSDTQKAFIWECVQSVFH